MKKRISGKKLSRTTNERKQLFRSLVKAVVEREYIDTSIIRAKAVQPLLERLVTKAKARTPSALRELVAETGSQETAKTLFELGKLFATRPGGYTRIIKLGNQPGDNTQLARLEWVEKLVPVEKVITPQTEVPTSAKKTAESAANSKKEAKPTRLKTREKKPI